jgi:replicative DNA helicase
MATLRQLAASLSDSGKGLYTAGLAEFDRLRIRLSPGQFIVVGGRPGMGKTCFLLFLYKQLWQENNLPLLFISTEEGETVLYKKLAATVSGIPEQELQEKAAEVLANHFDHLATNRCSIVMESRRWEKMKERIVEAAEAGTRIVIIDKLQTIYAEFPYPNRDQELAGITREMKQLAMEHQLLFIVSSSLSRNVETRMQHLPYLSDLRESGMIEENADAVLLVHRPEYYGITEDEHFNSMKDFMEVRVAKNRNGRTGSMKFAFRRKIPAVAIFEDFENKEFLDRFNFLEGGADPPF